jgi:Xaa-Pro dipeptidase
MTSLKITDAERLDRLGRLRSGLAERDLAGVLLGSTESLRYFTGLVWGGSERFCGALVTPDDLVYIAPGFEKTRVESLPHLPGDVRVWEEEESSAALVASMLPPGGRLALDDAMALFFYHALRRELDDARLVDGRPLIFDLRRRKSPSEIAIIRHAMELTLEVQKRARDFIRPGIAASEVVRFIDHEHQALGMSASTFCIVSFGAATALPHGAEREQHYAPGDIVLVDTGARIDGYHSDLTRTYMLDDPTPEFTRIWEIERAAQQAVFDAARLGATCASLDDAARALLGRHGLGPDYRLPGLPHRAGHGVGLEGHEEPYIVRGNMLPLAEGMCFSNEPMIVVEDFGVRLEDHVYMAADGAHWFTRPAENPTEV